MEPHPSGPHFHEDTHPDKKSGDLPLPTMHESHHEIYEKEFVVLVKEVKKLNEED